MGRKFIVRTDQKSLKFLLEQRLVSPEHQSWLVKLSGYDFDIQYRLGLENRAVDALSCLSGTPELATMTIPQGWEWDSVAKHNEQDAYVMEVQRKIREQNGPYVGFSLVHNTLLFKGRRVISKISPHIPLLRAEYHCTPVGGHSSIQKTYQRLVSELFWVGMRKDVEKYVQQCDICQHHKYMAMSPAGLLRPLPLPERIWDDVTMDFIERLPHSSGMDTILVVEERLSKYAHFLPLKHPFTAPGVAALFTKEVVKLHSIPRTIISNQDKVFMSKFWLELFKHQGTSLKRSTTHHPQTKGQSEVVNTYLRCFTSSKPK